MYILLITLNIMAGIFLVCVVLLQSGKGAEMGAAFGGASSTVFGPAGASTFMTKLTTATAATFMITSLLLAVMSARQQSVFDDMAEPVTQTAPPIAPIAPVAAPANGAGSEQAAAAPPASGQAQAAAESGQAAAVAESGQAPAPAAEPSAQSGQAPAPAPAGGDSGAGQGQAAPGGDSPAEKP